AMRHHPFFSFIIPFAVAALFVLLACGSQTALPPACTSNSDCTTGYQCINGECGVPPTSSCPGSETSCGGKCTDASSDPKNCGSCGHVCSAGLACSNGTCQSACAVGLSVCGTKCVDEASDPANCGKCGTTCPASGSCVAGACACPHDE